MDIIGDINNERWDNPLAEFTRLHNASIRRIKDKVITYTFELEEAIIRQAERISELENHVERIADLEQHCCDCEELIVQLRERITELSHVIFELIIAPNCATCSDNMSKLCDNGTRCMERVLNAEFIRYDQLKKDKRISELTQILRVKQLVEGRQA